MVRELPPARALVLLPGSQLVRAGATLKSAGRKRPGYGQKTATVNAPSEILPVEVANR